MKRLMCGFTVTFVILGLVLGLANSAHAADVPGNDSCATASPLPPAYGTGTLDSSDTVDFYQLAVVANFEVSVEMNPGYEPVAGKNYDLDLRDPNCNVVASSANPGISIEHIDYFAAQTGTYYVEVRRVSGSGLYDLAAFSTAQGSNSCTASSTPGLLAISAAECPLSSPVCATGVCPFTIQVQATGIGSVSASYHGVSCTGVNSCSSPPIPIAAPTFSDVCTSAIGATVATSVTVTCTVG